MGGIAGYIDFHKKTREDTLRKMIEEIHHRGPDCQMHEHLELSEAHIGMGQTDLSIHETNPNGKKPFHYKSLSIILDGEIYNLKEIKALLNDSDDHFASYSDSEIILCAFEKWGVEFIHKLNGIYVIVIFDSKKEKLYIFRDRPGVRPLYYFWKDGIFLFASEIKSLHVHPDFKRDIDVDALSLYFNYGYIPAPHSIFERTYKIESGKYLKMDLKSRNLSNESYWNIEDYYHREKYDIGFDEAKEKVHELMVSSCNYRMEGNVPVGITLSGGYDSTAIAAIIQKNWTEKIKTFTIGFEEGGNEAPFARETARFLGTDHTEYICTTEEAQKIIQELAYYYDEPFADDSAIPTMLVSRLIKTHFDLAVFADGGDHIFAGRVGVLYNNQRLLNHIPGAIKGPIRPILNLLANITPVSLPQMKHKIRSIARSLNQNELVQAGNLFRY
ncbi:MAG: asparagine synthase (glutamine-hydrolyzing), partial [Bacteroidetes bacterium]